MASRIFVCWMVSFLQAKRNKQSSAKEWICCYAGGPKGEREGDERGRGRESNAGGREQNELYASLILPIPRGLGTRLFQSVGGARADNKRSITM